MQGIILGSEELAQKVHIRGNDGGWHLPKDTPSDGKLPHIASVIDAIREASPEHAPTSRRHVILLDDDFKNIRFADNYGYKSVHFPNLRLPGINIHSKPSAQGVNVIHRAQLRHGALLCISSGSIVSFEGFTKGSIVNAANEGGLGGGGVDGAISRAGGDALYAARRALPEESNGTRIPTGSSRLTGPAKFGSLKVPFVIHAVGPNYNRYSVDQLAIVDELLVAAYESAMRCARTAGIELLAFPLISAGVFRGPRSLRDVLTIAITTLLRNSYEGLREVHLVCFTTQEVESLLEIIKEIEQGEAACLLGSGGSMEIKDFLRKFESVCIAPP